MKKVLFSLLFLASLALVGVLVMRAMPQQQAAATAAPPPKPPADPTMVLAAATPLAAGTLLRAQDVTWRTVETAEPGMIVRPSVATRTTKPEADEETRADVYGAAVREPIAEGEAVRRGGIVKPGDRGFVNAVLTPGTRAITIPVSMGSSGTGLVYPGDRVDLILTQTFKNDDAPLTRRSVSETVAEGLRILAIDKVDPKASPLVNNSRTVTLEVRPQEAEKINVAAELGKLSLTVGSSDMPSAAAASGVSSVKPTWAGDVSPALRTAVPPAKVVQAERPAIKVMRGNRAEEFKTE